MHSAAFADLISLKQFFLGLVIIMELVLQPKRGLRVQQNKP